MKNRKNTNNFSPPAALSAVAETPSRATTCATQFAGLGHPLKVRKYPPNPKVGGADHKHSPDSPDHALIVQPVNRCRASSERHEPWRHELASFAEKAREPIRRRRATAKAPTKGAIRDFLPGRIPATRPRRLLGRRCVRTRLSGEIPAGEKGKLWSVFCPRRLAVI